jgi:hypothetical protein
VVITQLTLLKDSSPLVHIKSTNQTTRTEGVKVQFLTPFKKRDHDSWVWNNEKGAVKTLAFLTWWY